MEDILIHHNGSYTRRLSIFAKYRTSLSVRYFLPKLITRWKQSWCLITLHYTLPYDAEVDVDDDDDVEWNDLSPIDRQKNSKRVPFYTWQ